MSKHTETTKHTETHSHGSERLRSPAPVADPVLQHTPAELDPYANPALRPSTGIEPKQVDASPRPPVTPATLTEHAKDPHIVISPTQVIDQPKATPGPGVNYIPGTEIVVGGPTQQ